MPHQIGAKGTRRLARATGLPTITRAWAADTGPMKYFATWDHEHGQYNTRTGEVTIDKDDPFHPPSCYGPGGQLLADLDPFDDDGHWPTLLDTNGES